MPASGPGSWLGGRASGRATGTNGYKGGLKALSPLCPGLLCDQGPLCASVFAGVMRWPSEHTQPVSERLRPGLEGMY